MDFVGNVSLGLFALIGASIALIALLDQFKRGRRRLALGGSFVVLTFIAFLMVDRPQRTGRSLDAVAVACKPKAYRTPSACAFKRIDGTTLWLPASEALGPGAKVMLEEVRTNLTGRVSWHVHEGRQ